MEKNILKDKTKKLAIDIIKLSEHLTNTATNQVIGRQLIRCSTSVGANYRAACRAKSSADFINKLKIVEEETDETMYFLELLKETGHKNLDSLYSEANEILAMVVASIKTTRAKMSTSNRNL